MNGSNYKYKRRLVIKGYKYRDYLDYFDTYSVVTRTTFIRMTPVITTLWILDVHQIDVKKTYSNGDLEGKIYMEHFRGFSAPGQENKV